MARGKEGAARRERLAPRPAPGGLLAIDKLFAGYLVATGALAAVAGGARGAAVAALHLVAVAVVVLAGRAARPRARWAVFLRCVYPVALTPLLYLELATLNRFLFAGYFDAAVQGWEAALFGGQPSLETAARLPAFWLSEFLHLGYFCYYLLIPSAAVGVFLSRGGAAAHRLAFATACAFFASYVVFVAFPVAGPRYLFPGVVGAGADGGLHQLVHAVLERGSSKGTAFPSSHVAAAATAVLACWREDRRWFWFLLLPVAALTAGTVYGGFHYAVDSVAGLALAGAAHAGAPALLRRLGEPRWETGIAGRAGAADAGAERGPPPGPPGRRR